MKKLLAIALCVLMAVACLGPAYAGESTEALFEAAKEAYETGDYETALNLLLPLTEQGYAPALNLLGRMYTDGKGVEQSYEKALEYYLLAAEQGFEGAAENAEEVRALLANAGE